MDIALIIDQLVPSADYRGSLTGNGKADYDNLEWLDSRAKPKWSAIERAAVDRGRADLVAAAADARWRKEIAGIDVGGMSVATDRGSQAMIAGAHAYLSQSPESVIRFKDLAGFATLNAEAVKAVALAVGAHVQACFAIEAELFDAIGSGAITTVEEVNAAFD